MGMYLINMNDGRLVFRNEETDKQVNLKPVSDEIVAMIMKKEVTARDVINAISIKIKESGEFNLEEYISAMKTLNVRTSNPQKESRQVVLADRTDEEVSISEINDAKEKTAKAEAAKAAKAKRKANVKKVSEALDAETAENLDV